ncbi:MAG: helicase SNF2, partial [Clostridium sp.]|nr:helicase SNF2 [Clostridium sp.]
MGIRIARGGSARYGDNVQVIGWERAAERIDELLSNGEFASRLEVAEALSYERRQTARQLWDIARDLSDEGKEMGLLAYLRSEVNQVKEGFPAEAEKCAQLLSEPESRDKIIREYAEFMAVYGANREVMRFKHYDFAETLKQLHDLTLPRLEYASNISEIKIPPQFITEDEINAALSLGSSFSDSKRRIYNFFREKHTAKEKADFLKNEYGIGGGNNAFPGSFRSDEWHDGKGVKYSKPNCSNVQLNWNMVAKRIDKMLEQGRYVTPEELAKWAEQAENRRQKQQDNYAKYLNIKRERPADIVLYQVGAFFEAYGEDAKALAQQFNLTLTSRNIHNAEPIPMCGFPSYLLQRYTVELQETQSVTVAETNKEVYTLPVISEQPERTAAENEPTIGASYAEYKPQIAELVAKDTAYINACRNSDKDTAYLEGSEAIKRAVLASDNANLQKLYWDTPSFSARLHKEILAETYPILSQQAEPEIEIVDIEPEIIEEISVEEIPVAAVENKPQYAVGDTVYLDNSPFRIETIDKYNVHLLDLSFVYPIGRVENIANFERLLRQDERNKPLYNIEETGSSQPETTAQTAKVEPETFVAEPEDIVIETPEVEINEPEVEVVAAENYRITDANLGAGGQKAKYAMNTAAIRTLKQIEAEKRQATTEEQAVLAKYVGWGALPEVFDKTKENWRAEYQELQSLLEPEEYAAARGSVLNAHYTSPTVIKAMYEGLRQMGFTGGKILEPSCGVGNFFGLLPEEMSQSQLYGVELDSLTGRIARQLYPKANIQIKGFEDTNFQNNSFDIAVGNVPFGNYGVFDAAYNKLGFSIHNYFFAKALDKLRRGGVLAFVTSRYTMDSRDKSVRRYLAERADLLGAIRLPNNAFKSNAGTEVVADIIFLQKREQLRDLSEDMPNWVNTEENAEGFKINEYFLDRPEQVLGIATAESTQYAGQDYTVEPIPGADLAALLQGAVGNIHGEYLPAAPDLAVEPLPQETPDISGVKLENYTFGVINGDIYYCLDGQNEKQNLGALAKRRLKGLIGLRDCTRELIAQQMDERTSDEEIQTQQKRLNILYNQFNAEFGLINDRANRLAFAQDSSYYLLCALEILDDKGRLKRKADMFTKRTIMPHKAPEKADTAVEAYAISIAEKAGVDLPYMAKLTGKTEEELTSELQGIIFFDPIKREWQPADEYLSGNVRRKLKIAEAAALENPAYNINVEALKQVQPRDLEAQEIEVRLGTAWIPKEYFEQFMWEVLQTPPHLRKTIKLLYSKYTNEWRIDNKNAVRLDDVAAYNTYGTERANGYKILEDSLNLRDARIYDTVETPSGGEKRVINAKETTLTQQKQQALKDAFKDWIWSDPERREKLVKKYNEEMNCTRPREYDGSHINFVGMSPEITLREHQINAIARVLYGGNTLLAHEVGA